MLLNFAQITNNAVILTANRRLALHLQEEHANFQRKLNKKAWNTLTILPLNTWLAQCWQQCQDRGYGDLQILLNERQEHYIWEQIIEQSPEADSLLRLAETAQSAQQAWQLLTQWQIPLDTDLFSQTEDTLAFQIWAKHYRAFCQENHWVDSNDLMNQILLCIQKNIIQLPTQLYLAGFTELTPQQQRLLGMLRHHGCAYHLLTLAQPATTIQRLILPDTTTEITTMARWAKQLLVMRAAHHIGCVVPNLSEIRNDVEHIFTAVFATTGSLPFNLSAGTLLNQFPIIHTALLILSLGKEIISLSDFGVILRSPFLGHSEQEIAKRARFDIFLRAKAMNNIIPSQALTHAQRFCPIFAKQLQVLTQIVARAPEKQLPSRWAIIFRKILETLAWPGDRELNSTEFQLVERWRKLLEELTSLDPITAQQSFTQALTALRQLARQTIFQPKTATTPIQILGTLETMGMHFEHLWIMGLHDTAWPASPTPHPFIPYALQRKHQIPHASAERELQFSRTITESLLHSSQQILISSPQEEQDRELHPSPLIKHFPEVNVAKLKLADYTPYNQQVFANQKLDFFTDDYAPPLTPEQSIAGGTQLFKRQAACPFQAFATLRLGAKPLETPQIGLTASARGSVIHHILEHIWNTLKNHQALSESPTQKLQEIIRDAIDASLIFIQQKQPQILPKRFAQLEKKRLTTLINEWLTLEKQRTPFQVIATEQETIAYISALPIHMRIDRIDQLPDGSHIIIDYKTNTPTISDWLGDRPDDPQLPIYCITSNLNINGLVFAQIRANEMRFKGLATTEIGIANTALSPNWHEQIVEWKKILENLGQQFREGYAKVDPKNPPQTCQTCGLHMLCRIHEMTTSPSVKT